MPTLSADALIDFSQKIFVAAGVPTAEAQIVASSLVDSNLCGHDSHGVIRIPQYIGNLREGKLTAGQGMTILNETPAVLAADGAWGLGQVLAYQLLEKMLPKAKSLGVAVGTLRRCGHTGRLGEYAEWAAKQKMAFWGTVNSHGSGRRVSPPGGTQGRISTNPLCMGAPTPTDPVYLDIGTSAVAEGKVRVHFQKKEAVPDGWLVDAQGKPSNDPAVLYDEKARGSILPFGGNQAYKGFGLGLLLDILCGGLSGGECSRPEAPLPGLGNCVVFLLFDPEKFGGTDHFLAESGKLTEFVRSTPTAEGVTQITLPGDPERTMRKQRQATGISIPDGTWTLLVKTAEELKIEVPAV